MDTSTTAAPAWELSKENAAPLQQGRNVVELEKSFSTAATSSKKLSETQQEENQKMIEHYERLVRPKSNSNDDNNSNDDPLIHWLSYIKYFQDTFPSDTHEQFLLMERCTRDLVSNPRYANDVRFIRVCVTYADKTSSPQDVFKYLHSQKVGSGVALFWVAWAWVSENKGDYAFAEKVFKKGISKNAKPIKMLKQRQKQFQRRMSRHWLNTSSADAIDEEAEEEGSMKRGALGSLSRDAVRYNDRSSRSSSSGSQQRQRGQQHGSSLSTFSVRNNSIQSSSSTGNGNVPSAKGGFQVFVEENNENEGGYNLDQSHANIGSREMVKDADRKKENTLAAARWDEHGGLRTGGATTSSAAISNGLPPSNAVPNVFSAQARSQSSSSSSSSSSGPPPPFVIHVDEECAAELKKKEEQEEHEREKERCQRERDQRTLRQKMDAGIAEKLARDPMRYVKNASKLASDQAKEEQHQHSNNKERAGTNSTKDGKKESQSSGGGVSCGFNKRLLSKDSTGQEQCFEEGRSKISYYRLLVADTNFNMLAVPKVQDASTIDEDIEMEQASIDEDDVEMEEDPSVGTDDQAPSKSPYVRKVLFCPNTSVDSRNVSFGRNASTASSTVDENAAVGGPVAKEEETINTKLAMKELSMMFASPVMGLEDISEGGPPQVQQSFMEGGASDSFRAVDDTTDENHEEDGDTASFSVVEGLFGPNQNETSTAKTKDGNENHGAPRNPRSRINTTNALRSLDDYPNSDQPDDHIDVETEVVNAGGGFAVYCDDEVSGGGSTPVPGSDEPPTKEAFEIYQDKGASKSKKNTSLTKGGFEIFYDDAMAEGNDPTKSKSRELATSQKIDIFCDDQQDSSSARSKEPNCAKSSKSAPFSIFQDGHSDDEEETKNPSLENGDDGDTATFSQVGDALDFLDDFGQQSVVSSRSKARRKSSKFQAVYKTGTPTDDFKRYGLPNNATGVLLGNDCFGDISRIDVDEN